MLWNIFTLLIRGESYCYLDAKICETCHIGFIDATVTLIVFGDRLICSFMFNGIVVL